MIECAKIGNDGTVIDVVVDHKTYKGYENGNRVLSDFFNVTIPPNNVMDYEEPWNAQSCS